MTTLATRIDRMDAPTRTDELCDEATRFAVQGLDSVALVASPLHWRGDYGVFQGAVVEMVDLPEGGRELLLAVDSDRPATLVIRSLGHVDIDVQPGRRVVAYGFVDGPVAYASPTGPSITAQGVVATAATVAQQTHP